MSQSRHFEPTRAAGLARLAAFVPAAGRAYANGRNSDHGPNQRGNVSALSPYVRHRLVTEREVLSATLGRHSLGSAEKFVQEVYWRTYFKGHLETRPEIWTRYRADVARLSAAVSERGGGLAKAYRAAVEGRTGIDGFDAWAEELVETGYLHNHARMWFASIWIFTLKLPWQLGADFTYRHFLDGDAASNTLSWRWVGGLHTKGKTYLARPDNIAGYTGGRFRPEGLARIAEPLDEAAIGPARPIPACRPPATGKALLLLTEEDLHPESLDLAGLDIAGVALADAVAGRSPLEVSPGVVGFTEGALADAAARAGRHFGVEPMRLPSLTAVTLADAARAAGVSRIVTPYAPVGPVAEALAEASPRLVKAGVTLEPIRRPFDTSAWPFATRGFFALKERIPELIAEAGLGPQVFDDARQGELL
jgi:deoxyribodipyrimidine photo-lyase